MCFYAFYCVLWFVNQPYFQMRLDFTQHWGRDNEVSMRALATTLTWTPGRKLQSTRLDMARAWSLHALQQPGSAPESPSPAPRPTWPRHALLCWGLRLLCPGCSLRAPRAAARASYTFSAQEHTLFSSREKNKHFVIELGKETTNLLPLNLPSLLCYSEEDSADPPTGTDPLY